MSDLESKDFPTVSTSEQKTDGLGKPDDAAGEACKRAQEAGAWIVADYGPVLSHKDKAKAVTLFRRALIPPKRPGRKPKEAVTAAHRDFETGMRGSALYRAHIPGWEKHNRYRRKYEERALMAAINTRKRRLGIEAASNRPPRSA